MLDKEKLIKIMMLTTSDADGESLNAIRAANAMLLRCKINWEEVLSGKPASAPNFDKSWEYKAPPKQPRKDAFGYTQDDWDSIIAEVDKYVRGNAREFIESVATQWYENRRLSIRQKSAILKFRQNL